VYGGYTAAAAATYSLGTRQHRDLNCRSAIKTYGLVANFFALSLTTSRANADERRSECRLITKAQEAECRGNNRAAADRYAEALHANPSSPIRSRLVSLRADRLLRVADDPRRSVRSEREADFWREAVLVYQEVVLESPRSRQADEARRPIWEMGGVHSRHDVCTAGAILVLLANSSGFRISEAQRLREYARDAGDFDLYRCGMKHFRHERYFKAAEYFKQAIAEFPRGAWTARARNKLIEAEVAAIRGGKTAPLPPPSVSGTSGRSNLDLRIRNSSPYPFEVLLSGPSPRRFTVPACSSCATFSAGNEPQSCPPGTVRTISIAPGTYSAVVQSTGKATVVPWSGDRTLSGGYVYSHCFYIVTRHG
jgi:outer membrane protein assembly factor BamD (BamD/ComL family)